MRKGSLDVTFFSVRPSVRYRPVSVQWSRSGLEVDWKLTGSGPVSVWWTRSGHYARDLQAQGACALRFFNSKNVGKMFCESVYIL